MPVLDVQSKIKEEEEKNKPPEQDEYDAKGKKISKKDTKKESKDPKDANKDNKKEAKKEAKKDTKKDTKKKGGEIKIAEPIKEPEDKTVEYQRNNYGVACFFLVDFLKANVRNVKLRAPLIPVKKFEDLEK